MSMGLVSILITSFEIGRNLSIFASCNRWPRTFKLNLSMLRWWNSIMSMSLVSVLITSLKVSRNLTSFASSD